MNNLFFQFMQFMRNPRQFMAQMGIPAEKMGNPNDAIQWMLNNGKVNQSQYNTVNQQANQLKNDPHFQQMMK